MPREAGPMKLRPRVLAPRSPLASGIEKQQPLKVAPRKPSKASRLPFLVIKKDDLRQPCTEDEALGEGSFGELAILPITPNEAAC